MIRRPVSASSPPGEFRANWRALLSASLGVGTGWSLNGYILSALGPHIIADFGWTRAQWAWLGIVQLATIVVLPVTGRLADLFGVRRVAAVGAFGFPVSLAAFILLHGDLGAFIAILLMQMVVGSTTTVAIYSRVVADAFSLRRGLALGLFGSSTPVIAALGAPALGAFATAHGWRAACLLVAGLSLACAIAVLALLPRDRRIAVPAATRGARPAGAYRTIFASPTFRMLLTATFLVNVPFSFAMSQLKIVALAQGLSDGAAALAISGFATGAIVGRLATGVALDRLPTRLVSAVAFALPAAGALVLASDIDAPAAIIAAVLLIGLSFGGEGDILPFVVVRHFGMATYSTVMGLLSAAIGLALAVGNGVIGLTVDATGGYDTYLMCAAAAALLGSVLFFLLGRGRVAG